MDWGRFLTSLHGRIGRKSYWLFIGLNVAASLIAMLVDAYVLRRPDNGPVLGLLNLVLMYPWICVVAKRLHDFGLSGWWQVAGYILFFAAAVLLMDQAGKDTGSLLALGLMFAGLAVLGGLKGQAGPNRFGEPNSGDREVASTAEVFS